jgi:hypothetical protein
MASGAAKSGLVSFINAHGAIILACAYQFIKTTAARL